MKKHRFWFLSAHATIILSVVVLTLFIVDRFNPNMEFLGSEESDWLLLCFSLVSCVSGVLTALQLFRQARRREREESRLEPKEKE